MTEQTVLVTGGAGYIGSHACKALRANGLVPVVYDNLCSGNREAVKWGPLEPGDIRDRSRLKEVILRHNPMAVMHFAALIQVGESVSNPSIYYENNVYGSYCLLEEARAAGISNLVFSSTAAVYGNPQSALIAEDHPLSPINPYGHTKLAMETMIRDYAAAYPLHYGILRYFNAAGADPECETGSAYRTESHLITLLMKVAAGGMPDIKVFGDDYATPDGTAIRDYIHVTDLAQAHVLALKHLMQTKQSLTLNLGTSAGSSVSDVIAAARRITGRDIPASINPRRAGDPPQLVADAAQARRVLNWVPQTSAIERIIATAWAWRQRQEAMGRTGAFATNPLNKEAA